MPPVKKGDTVQVHYTGKLDDGTEFDSSKGRDPLEFTVGQGQVIPGFEEMVQGMEPGQSKTETIPSDNAYGPYQEQAVFPIDKEQIPDDMEIEEGDRLRLQHPSGQAIDAIVAEIGDEEIKMDGNHPLAGKDLTFEIELLDVE